MTHLHSDHCGLVPKFAKEESVIYSGETDGELMNFEAGNLYWRILDDMFLKFGFPKAEFGRNTDIHPGRKYVHDSKIDFTYVNEGRRAGVWRIQTAKPIETPGHTPGSTCAFTMKRGRILFCGDHILGTITPNITIELAADNAGPDYLNSLAKVEKLDVEPLLTAHGTPVDDMYQRIEETVQTSRGQAG